MQLVVCVWLLASMTMAQFSLYPSIDADKLAKAFNISTGCLDALNTTVSCDQTLLTMAGTVDDYLWSIDNTTELCTSTCLSSAKTWFDGVYSSCADDSLQVMGKQVPPHTIPGRTVDGLNIACLTPTTDVSKDPGVGGSVVVSTNETDGTSPSSRRRQSSSSGYCLIDSYDWVGSDIIRPDCSLASNQNASQCLDPTDVPAENERIVNLYPDDLVCSDCFIKMFYLRVASPYLPDLDYSDYLVQQYFDILDVCNNTKMPDLLVRMLPKYTDSPGYFNGKPVNTSSLQPLNDGPTGLLPNATAPEGTCSGQVLTYSDLETVAGSISDPGKVDFCDAISKAFNVSSGDLYQAFGNYGCDTEDRDDKTATWCVPQGCTVYEAPQNGTCTDIVKTVSTPQHNITTLQLAQYNPNFQGLCDSVLHQYVCITPPGGAYVPPPTNRTSDDSSQQRGGGDKTSTGNQTVTGHGNPEITVTAGGPVPLPTQSGIVSDCKIYSNASAGDTCYSFTQQHNILASDLYTWNPVLGDAGAYCPTHFWSGYFYCIGTSIKPTPTSTTSASSAPTSVPSPTQSGIVPTCDKYAKVTSGDTCSSFASANGIGTTDLYTWNTQLGSQGENCGSKFWAGYYYCVHAPSATSSPIPSPTQSGIVSNCDKYAEVNSGDTCPSFAQANAITANDLYEWNTQLGAKGENCATKLWAGYYYCVHAPPPPAPSPTQPGIVSNCNKYAKSQSGDSCPGFASRNDITADELYEWNTQLGSNGANCASKFWADYYYCTGVDE